MALRRFSSRRGTPTIAYSDNGKNFKGLNKKLASALHYLDYNSIIEEAAKLKIEWKFNPPTASHMGGAWEKLIHSVKTALRSVIKDRNPNEEVLHTLLLEIEHSVNSRPLTHVLCDAGDGGALTSNHFLLGSSAG